jgi:hypothetical protein
MVQFSTRLWKSRMYYMCSHLIYAGKLLLHYDFKQAVIIMFIVEMGQ